MPVIDPVGEGDGDCTGVCATSRACVAFEKFIPEEVAIGEIVDIGEADGIDCAMRESVVAGEAVAAIAEAAIASPTVEANIPCLILADVPHAGSLETSRR